MTIRPITPADNAAMAHVIRTVMPEFNCVGEGYSINDPEVDDMAGTYSAKGSRFFVVNMGAAAGAEEGIRAGILGGAGYAPLTGHDGSTCELRKMYLLTEARGLGAGRALMDACLAAAKADGYAHIYLETVTAMTDAAALYMKYGFEYLDEPLGDTGHDGCDRWMMRRL